MTETQSVDYEGIPCETEPVERDLHQRLKDINAINKIVFPKGFFDEKEITEGLDHRRSVLVLLKRSDTREIVGYGLAVPTYNKTDVAHYVANAIIPELQGKGHIVAISHAVEDGLRDKGFVKLTRETRVAGGYADKVRSAYGNRILKETKTKNKLGDAIEFEIQL